ncbi:PAS domain S-box protein [Egbenema bharatensis]|uniref:PAS domain S-box protein n=1 Tax=Egbenema bharatensis TaxID=3463334 RepID=UPI003A853D71
MSNVNLLSHRIEKIRGRLSALYQNVNASTLSSADLLPTALVELGIVSESLQLAMEELARQQDLFANVQKKVEGGQHRYQTLFELIPTPYLVTDSDLQIQEANRAAAELFNTQQQFLSGKSLAHLVLAEDLPLLQAKLSQIHQRNRIELSGRLHRYCGNYFNANLTISATTDWETGENVLYWLLQDVTESKRVESALQSADYDAFKDRSLHYYSKGEIISLEPSKIWLVASGVAKLTTLSDRGEEMLIGLVRDSMIFGSSLTALQTYQAIALSKMQLVSIPLTEISQSPRLAQFLLPLLEQRLRQTESFLSIYGQLRVENRLSHLLSLLKQEIGQPVEDGVRLRVRLTHHDFASVCCTTRVTVTRLLGKLQQEGKITFDSRNHIIVKEDV